MINNYDDKIYTVRNMLVYLVWLINTESLLKKDRLIWLIKDMIRLLEE